MTEDRYIPAAGHPALTRLYDPILAATTRERTFRGRLLDAVRAALPDGGRVLDVGCGTGTFALAVAAARPDAEVVGLDGDPDALAIARGKSGGGAPPVTWREALATALPEEDASADAVVVSLVLHHLGPDAKLAALTEARRVLRPDGMLHVADWGRPHDPLMRVAFFGLQLVDGFPTTRDHAAGRLPTFIADAGFVPADPYARLRTVFGSLELRAHRVVTVPVSTTVPG
jgi:ubiquinone/menaquinone biosynthesis C-methylase UbiE